jgi:beta-phosphoglucomutase-like phosphatase (HAD superfamily)
MPLSPAAAAVAPAAPGSTLEHLGIDMRVDEFLRFRDQVLYLTFRGVPYLPGVEEFVRAMNKAGVRMAAATSSPTRLLEANSAGKEVVFAMFEGVVCGDDVKCGKSDTGFFLKAAEILGVPSCSWGAQCPKPKYE